MFIVVAPSLTTRPSNITIDEDDEAEFQCIATGNPIPKISWINESGKTVGTGETLTLKANRTDSGKYLCLADNGFKTTVNASAYLNVLCKSEHIITINVRKLSELADFEVVISRSKKHSLKLAGPSSFTEIRKNSTSSTFNGLATLRGGGGGAAGESTIFRRYFRTFTVVQRVLLENVQIRIFFLLLLALRQW